MTDYAGAYRATRGRVTDLVRDADASTAVPACPGWTVACVLSHLAGTTADILAGNLDGVTTDPWTQAQVDARKGRSIDDLLVEWNENGPQVEALAPEFGDAAGQLVFDATTHEHDLRGAIDAAGAHDSEAVVIGAQWRRTRLGTTITESGAPALRVVLDGEAQELGDGTPVGTLTATAFDFMRSLSGRRTRDQVLALDWSADPAPWVDAFVGGPFSWPEAPVE